ncbi:LTXXQ motif family protein [Ancylobacter aquaticus]|uniref:LTXXQ motif family protein n=1 Tax=Ancylobacter aquaticus TaxID=100 RepID=A0A4R1I062_ANCAQ|nr:Spy/CpxP family protein refolding chaperone [Ancylobacter aquaticus]TCK23272.1 LTXXQ motif family protein [Ancylobacter aquaticus]
MKHTIIAATAAALLAGVTFGVAAPKPGAGDHPRPSVEQMAEFSGAMSEARIAALQAGLRLTADQEKLWPALESALQAAAKERMENRAERRAERADKPKGERPDVIERLRAQADGMVERGQTMKKVADAAAPLYDSLDGSQQRRFAILFKQVEHPRMASGRHGKDHGPHRAGPGRHGPDGPMHHRMPPGPMNDGPNGPAAGPDAEPL